MPRKLTQSDRGINSRGLPLFVFVVTATRNKAQRARTLYPLAVWAAMSPTGQNLISFATHSPDSEFSAFPQLSPQKKAGNPPFSFFHPWLLSAILAVILWLFIAK